MEDQELSERSNRNSARFKLSKDDSMCLKVETFYGNDKEELNNDDSKFASCVFHLIMLTFLLVYLLVDIDTNKNCNCEYYYEQAIKLCDGTRLLKPAFAYYAMLSDSCQKHVYEEEYWNGTTFVYNCSSTSFSANDDYKMDYSLADDYLPKYDRSFNIDNRIIAIIVFIFNLSLTFHLNSMSLRDYSLLNIKKAVLLSISVVPTISVLMVNQVAQRYIENISNIDTYFGLLSVIVIIISYQAILNSRSVSKIMQELRSNKFTQSNLISTQLEDDFTYQDRIVAIEKYLLGKENLKALQLRLKVKMTVTMIYTAIIGVIYTYDMYHSIRQLTRSTIVFVILNSLQLLYVSILQVTTFNDEVACIESENKITVNLNVNVFGFTIGTSQLASIMYATTTDIIRNLYSQFTDPTLV